PSEARDLFPAKRSLDSLRSLGMTAAIVIAAAIGPVGAQSASAPPDSSGWWRDAARKDLAAAREIMNTRFIAALSSGGPAWTTLLDGAAREADGDVPRVKDAASYQSVLKRFVSAFDDAHVRVRFKPSRSLEQE